MTSPRAVPAPAPAWPRPGWPVEASLAEGVLPLGTAIALAGWLLLCRPLRLRHGSPETPGGR